MDISNCPAESATTPEEEPARRILQYAIAFLVSASFTVPEIFPGCPAAHVVKRSNETVMQILVITKELIITNYKVRLI
jgi:hypothetical protein